MGHQIGVLTRNNSRKEGRLGAPNWWRANEIQQKEGRKEDLRRQIGVLARNNSRKGWLVHQTGVLSRNNRRKEGREC